MPLKLILGDKNPELIEAWQSAFTGCENVHVRGGNILLARADALVSPANSFGFMDGGIDWSISEMFNWKIQAIVQQVIRERHGGELLVGQAEIVRTENERFPYLVCAPTMRVPQNVADSINAFLAMRAILLCVKQFNARQNNAISSLAIPGLCTGAGRMPFDRSARQMKAAYDQVFGGIANQYPSLKEAIAFEKGLKT